MKTKKRKMMTWADMKRIEKMRQELSVELLAAGYPKCQACGGSDNNIPSIDDGRLFCCAIDDIIKCDEDAVTWEEMQNIANWSGIRVKNLRESHEGYIEQAVILLPIENANLPEPFYSFPDDLTMIETPQERKDFALSRLEISDYYL